MTKPVKDELFTESKITGYASTPGNSVSSIYRKQPKLFQQLGKATAYSSNGDRFEIAHKPSYYQLAAWDEVRVKEPILKQGLSVILLSFLARIGPYQHQNAEIEDFINANIETKLKQWVSDLFVSSLWSGYGVSEIQHIRKTSSNGLPQIWIEKLVNYHPLSVQLVLNDYNQVVDGDKLKYSPHFSGVYVPAPTHYLEEYNQHQERQMYGSHVRLPKYKRCYLTLNSEGNNPYGRSILKGAYIYSLYKEAFRDQFFTALDRYGTPLIYVLTPPQELEELVTQPDASHRSKTMQEKIAEEFENLTAKNALILTNHNPDNPVQVKTLTTGNNYGDSFERAIMLCDRNMMLSLHIPNLLIQDRDQNQLGSGKASETQAEVFHSFISSLFGLFMPEFTSQVIHPLIRMNFAPDLYNGVDSSGFFTQRPARSEDLKTTIDGVDKLTQQGYLSPSDPRDRDFVRDLLGIY